MQIKLVSVFMHNLPHALGDRSDDASAAAAEFAAENVDGEGLLQELGP